MSRGDEGTAASCMLDVLLVSGNRTYANAARIALSARGCRITTAMSGSAALALTREARFALLLVDERLPDCEGPRLLAQLGAQAGGGHIVLLMADTSSASAALASAAGAHAAYARPPTASGLVEIVRREAWRNPPLLDDAIIDELRAAIAGPGARAALLARFEEEARALWSAADEAIASRQPETLASLLHRLRGATAGIGALACETRLAGIVILADAPLVDTGHWSACQGLFEQSINALRAALMRP